MSSRSPASSGNDELLIPFLQAVDQEQANQVLGRLLFEVAEPLIKDIVRRELLTSPGASALTAEMEDLRSDVNLRLVARLRECHGNPDSRPIASFRSYVAVSTFHACHQYLRRKYPLRARLKNRLRYILAHRRELALWSTTDGQWLCGLAAWRGRRPVSSEESRKALAGDADSARWQETLRKDTGWERPEEFLLHLFYRLEAPVGLDFLVAFVSDFWGLKDRPEEAESREGNRESWPEAPPAAAGLRADEELQQKAFLQELWREICELPVRQRAALLLNLRAEPGVGVIEVFPLTGIASIREIAWTLEIPVEEFAALWKDLPLADTAIAERLKITRQQVINLRSAARGRLERRMRDFGNRR